MTSAVIESDDYGFELEVSSISNTQAEIWKRSLLSGIVMTAGRGGVSYFNAGFGFVVDRADFLVRGSYIPAPTESDSDSVLGASSSNAASLLAEMGVL